VTTDRGAANHGAMLRRALGPTADAAPMPADLLAVPDAWVVRDRARIRHLSLALGTMGAAVVATLTLIGLLTGRFGIEPPRTGISPTRDIGVPVQALDLEPRVVALPDQADPAIGPVLEVVRGRADGPGGADRVPFSVIAYRGAPPSEACIVMTYGPDTANGCGSLPGKGPTGGVFGTGQITQGAQVVHGVFGLVDPAVDEVWVEVDGGRTRALLIPLGRAEIDADLFLAFLPGGVDATAWVAVDDAGNVIDRLEIAPPPPDVQGPQPTPGS
jgi:hypothetical protein